MARWVRSPAGPMAVYTAIAALAGPWFSLGGPAHRTIVQLLVVAGLALATSRGSRPARVVLLLASIECWVITWRRNADSRSR